MKPLQIAAGLLLLSATLSGCTDESALRQEGSSTVLPLAEVWAEEFNERTGVVVNVAGGGSSKGASGLCEGRVHLGDMSRSMKESERDACADNGIEVHEWKVAFDGLSIVVAKGNTFLEDVTIEQLEHIFRKDDHAVRWSDVRPAIDGAPNTQIKVCLPDNESGTYEYFFEEVMDKGPFREDGTLSPDDNVLVECVAASPNAIGFFGFAYVKANADKIKAVKVEGVAPSMETIRDGSYSPLGRPLYIYTGEPEGDLYDYLHYILGDGQELVEGVGYVPLSDTVRQQMMDQLGQRPE